MKIVTAVTFWNDAIGKRLSVTFAEVDKFGQITKDNNRVDIVATDSKLLKHLDAIGEAAQSIVDAEGGEHE